MYIGQTAKDYASNRRGEGEEDRLRDVYHDKIGQNSAVVMVVMATQVPW